MTSFKDQLGDWKKENTPSEAPSTPVATRKACRVVSMPMSNKAFKKAPLLVAEGAYAVEVEAEVEEELDDADLFSAAVADIHSQSAAILAKYDATIEVGATRVGTSQEGGAVEGDSSDGEGKRLPRERVDPDKMAFLDAMGDLDRLK